MKKADNKEVKKDIPKANEDKAPDMSQMFSELNKNLKALMKVKPPKKN